MVQITTGTFGYYNGRKVVPITSADGPQKFDPELEARLVKQGIAKYVDAPAGQTETAGEQHEETPNTTADLPKYNNRMKLDELKKIAAAYGVDASAMTKKDEVIKAIDAAKAATEQTADDADDADEHDSDDGEGDEDGNDGSDEDEEPSARRRRSRLMAFDFKAMVANDLRHTFLNLEEFGETHKVEGKETTIVVDEDALKELAGGQKLVIAESSLLFCAAVEDLPPRRSAGEGLNVDGREYIILDWSEDMGLATIALGQNVTM